jgi:uncharacterized membrane protein
MEEIFKRLVGTISLSVEAVAALMIAFGAMEAVWAILNTYLKPNSPHAGLRVIWVHFGVWLMLALEFELAADIIRTAIAPTWTDIGQLASIGAIRTFLNYFLERDIQNLEPGRGGEVNRPPAALSPTSTV